MKDYSICIVVPALNEEDNILATIDSILKVVDRYPINVEIIAVNDGSKDKTEEIILECMKKDDRIQLISHDLPRGIGASFWEGVDKSKSDLITMLPGDNENDPWETLRYSPLLEHVDIVIPFVYNKEVRSPFRNILSIIYRVIINMTFLVNLNYTNGTIIYRRSTLLKLEYRSKNFFFQTDILIRAIKRGYLFAEVPCRLDCRNNGRSKAVSFPSLKQVICGYIRLIRDHYYYKFNVQDIDKLTTDSLSAIRYRNDNETN